MAWDTFQSQSYQTRLEVIAVTTEELRRVKADSKGVRMEKLQKSIKNVRKNRLKATTDTWHAEINEKSQQWPKRDT